MTRAMQWVQSKPRMAWASRQHTWTHLHEIFMLIFATTLLGCLLHLNLLVCTDCHYALIHARQTAKHRNVATCHWMEQPQTKHTNDINAYCYSIDWTVQFQRWTGLIRHDLRPWHVVFGTCVMCAVWEWRGVLQTTQLRLSEKHPVKICRKNWQRNLKWIDAPHCIPKLK